MKFWKRDTNKTEAKKLAEMASGSDDAMLPLVVEKNERRARQKFLPKLMKTAGYIPFSEDIAAAWYCTQDPETPIRVKAILLAAIGYFIVPTDMVPDIIAGLGFVDDATVITTALSLVSSHITDSHKRTARRLLGKPEKSAKSIEH